MKPLNKGDRVRIAGNPPHSAPVDLHGKVGTVERATPDPSIEGFDVLVSFDGFSCIHWCARRQLTKLVKPKERRRFWINVYPGDKASPVLVLHHSEESAESGRSHDRVECFEVLEVKNK